MRRQIAIVAVVALVALAGCSGVLTGGDASSDGPSNDTGTADEAPTLETIDYPDGYDANGITNVSAALSAHDDAAGNAAGVRISASMRASAGDQQKELTLESTVDNEAGTEYSKLELTETTNEVYRTADGMAYTRIDDGSNVQYFASQPESSNPVSLSAFSDTLSDDNLTATSVSREGSDTLITYTAEGTDDLSVELVVDTEGRIRSLSIDRADSLSADFTYEYGPVTVEEPDWLDDAKAATGA